MCGKIASLIALLPMLIHSIFGCCWHHAHCHVGHACSAVSSADEHSASDHCHLGDSDCRHDRSTDASGETHLAEQDSDDAPCDEDRCAHGEMLITTVSPFMGLQVWAITQCAVTGASSVQQSEFTVWGNSQDKLPSCSSRERRALTQVWLI